jgi:hypothetical protein
MKKMILTIAVALTSFAALQAQTKKDGSPDMRYKANKEYSSGYSTPSYSAPKAERNYSNGGQYKVQKGYIKSNGTYVSPHIKTTADNTKYNNYKPKY